jgi:hypothetical protein
MLIADLYIGSNNKTKVLELDIIRSQVDNQFSGSSIIGVEGRWKHQVEQSCIVRLLEDGSDFEAKVLKLRNQLVSALEQESIPVVWTNAEISW